MSKHRDRKSETKDLPEHTGKSLTHDVSKIVTQSTRVEPRVELVGIRSSLLEDSIEVLIVLDRRILFRSTRSKLETNDSATSVSRNVSESVVSGSLGTGLFGVDELTSILLFLLSDSRIGFVTVGRTVLARVAVLLLLFLLLLGESRTMGRNDVIVESVLGVRNLVGTSPDSLTVCVVVGEEEFGSDDFVDEDGFLGVLLATRTDRSGRRVGVEVVATESLVVRFDDSISDLFEVGHRFTGRSLLGPRPGVSEPELGYEMKSSGFRSSVVSGDSN